MALEKLSNESSRTEADPRAETVAVKEFLVAENARVESRKCKLLNKVEKKQQLLTELRETCQTAVHALTEGEGSLSGSQSKLTAMIAKRAEWFGLATETFGKLEAYEADAALQLKLRQEARKRWTLIRQR